MSHPSRILSGRITQTGSLRNLPQWCRPQQLGSILHVQTRQDRIDAGQPMELGRATERRLCQRRAKRTDLCWLSLEYEGEYAHNMVRKIRWANYPFVPGIAENIKSDWSEARLDSWVVTCTQCHSERFARSYLDLMDKGTLQGLAKYQEAHEVVAKLYGEGLLSGQKTNRPNPPAPEKPGLRYSHNYSGRKATTRHL